MENQSRLETGGNTPEQSKYTLSNASEILAKIHCANKMKETILYRSTAQPSMTKFQQLFQYYTNNVQKLFCQRKVSYYHWKNKLFDKGRLESDSVNHNYSTLLGW